MDALPKGQFHVIYCDPPWRYKRACSAGAASHHYETMGIGEICDMPVGDLAAPDCALLMWVTSPLLPEALKVMRAWGFQYKTVFFCWIKTTKIGTPCCGLGCYTRSSCELCLVGTRGRAMSLKQRWDVQQTILAPRREHSRKPDEARERIERFFGFGRGGDAEIQAVELFARESFPGWTVWGDEINKVF